VKFEDFMILKCNYNLQDLTTDEDITVMDILGKGKIQVQKTVIKG